LIVSHHAEERFARLRKTIRAGQPIVTQSRQETKSFLFAFSHQRVKRIGRPLSDLNYR
jgi:hypothetical protein